MLGMLLCWLGFHDFGQYDYPWLGDSLCKRKHCGILRRDTFRWRWMDRV